MGRSQACGSLDTAINAYISNRVRLEHSISVVIVTGDDIYFQRQPNTYTNSLALGPTHTA